MIMILKWFCTRKLVLSNDSSSIRKCFDFFHFLKENKIFFNRNIETQYFSSKLFLMKIILNFS